MKRGFLTWKWAVSGFTGESKKKKKIYIFLVIDLNFCIKKIACVFLAAHFLWGKRLSGQLEIWLFLSCIWKCQWQCLSSQVTRCSPWPGKQWDGGISWRLHPWGLSSSLCVSSKDILQHQRLSFLKEKPDSSEKVNRLWKTTICETRVVLMAQRG